MPDSIAHLDGAYSDGLQNLATGMGNPTYDPMGEFFMGASWGMLGLQDFQQIKLAEEGLLRKAIYNIPNACMASWGKVQIEGGDNRIIQKFAEELDDIPCFTETDELSGVRAGLNEAMALAFLSGNCAFIIEADDGNDMTEPLDIAKLNQIEAFHIVDRWGCTPDYNARGPSQYYYVNSSRRNLVSGRVHSSRVYWLYGMRRSPRGKVYAGGFDASILEQLAEPYLAYKSAVTNSGRMLQDFDVIFHKIKDLGKVAAQSCSGDKAAQAQLEGIKERLRVSAKSRSVFRSYVGDMDNEDFGNISRSVGGYRDLADFVKEYLPAVCEFPPAILFGEFANAGLNSGGKSAEDKQLWNDTIRSAQENRLSPIMTGKPSRRRRTTTRPPGILNLIAAQKKGPFKGKEPEGLTWVWNDLYPQTADERAQSELNWASLMGAIAGFDPRFAPNFILSRFGTPDSPVTLSEEYLKALREEVKNPNPPEEEALPEDEAALAAEEETLAAEEQAAAEEEAPAEDPPPEEEEPAEPTEDEAINAAIDEVLQEDSADDPIAANIRKALASPMGKGTDFAPAAIRMARAVANGQRPTLDQLKQAKDWMQNRQRYSKAPEGSRQKIAWLLRGGDEQFRKLTNREV